MTSCSHGPSGRPFRKKSAKGSPFIVLSCLCNHDYKTQGGLKVLKTIAPEVSNLNDGAKILIVDDLVDTGATAKLVREMLRKAKMAPILKDREKAKETSKKKGRGPVTERR